MWETTDALKNVRGGARESKLSVYKAGELLSPGYDRKTAQLNPITRKALL
jgi:hypothetical protein